jgi:hypothetical protein
MMTTNIMLNCVLPDAKVWWRFEYVDFIGYSNQEKLKFDEVYGDRLNAWWMFSTNNPRMIFSKNVLFDYYRNLEELIGLNINWEQMPNELNELSWSDFLHNIILNEEGEKHYLTYKLNGVEKDTEDNVILSKRGRPLGSRNKLKNIPTTIRRSYRIASISNI